MAKSEPVESKKRLAHKNRDRRLQALIWCVVFVLGFVVFGLIFRLPWHKFFEGEEPVAGVIASGEERPPADEPLGTDDESAGGLTQGVGEGDEAPLTPTLPTHAGEPAPATLGGSDPDAPTHVEQIVDIGRGSQLPGTEVVGGTPGGTRGIGRAAVGGRGSGGGAEFMGLRASGDSFVFVIDHSGTMAGGPIQAVKAQLTRSIEALEPGQKFFVIFYSSGPDLRMPANQLVEATRSAKDVCFNWMSGIPASGGTAPENAIMTALRMEPDAIYFLSDGFFDPGVADRARQANAAEIPIHTIGFSNQGEQNLRDLAEKNYGRFSFVGGGN